MARNPSPPPPNADIFAQQLAAAHTKFADAYRAWLEALAAKPEKMMDLQSQYMQEQMKLWMKAVQPESGKPEEVAEAIRWLATDAPVIINGAVVDITDGCVLR